MANGQLQALHEFVKLQLAAEAFLSRAVDPDPNKPADDRVEIARRLALGNTHASRFTTSQAEQFTTQYEVVAQYRNDPLQSSGSGFSATVFKRRGTEEYTLSIRSTEFIDDAVRDQQATNVLEIKDLGWAFGQIAELEQWYQQTLRAPGGLLEGKNFYVTGYSLGGHLATAFNILRRETDGAANPIIETYTFNGAGTGQILNGRRLTDLLSDFNQIRENYQSSPQWNALSLEERIEIVARAQQRLQAILDEHGRVALLNGVANETFQNATAPIGVQATLGYQIAALVVARDTVGALASNFPSTELKLALPGERIAGMTEVVGMEAGGLATSFVSNSGIHYGNRVQVPIEAQPLYRGLFPFQVVTSFFKPLVSDPANNDFGDTHSLVLLVDSLSLFASLERIAPNLRIETAAQIFAAASSASASESLGQPGFAEGDTLERLLDAARKLVFGPGQDATLDSEKLLLAQRGNSWHLEELRRPFHQKLEDLDKEITRQGLAGTLTVDSLASTPASILRDLAVQPDAFAYRYALKELNSFALTGSSALYERHRQGGELEQFVSAQTTPAGMTEQYIIDRAQMLAHLNRANTNNTSTLVLGEPIQQVVYQDLVRRPTVQSVEGKPTELVVVQQGVPAAPQHPNTRVIGFGTDSSDVLQGRNNTDRLYGGSGSDALYGGTSDDYLEGGAGQDIYEYSFLKPLIGAEANPHYALASSKKAARRRSRAGGNPV